MPTTNRPQIRLLEPADVPALLTIIADSRAEYGIGERGVKLLEPADRELYSIYQQQRSLYFVALLAGEIVGGAGIAPLKGADPLTCELQRMYLRRDARGRGIGEALLQHCLKAARQFLYVRCYLETISQMQTALAFYGRHGFKDLSSPRGCTGHEHNDRWLLRPLPASARDMEKPRSWNLRAVRLPGPAKDLGVVANRGNAAESCALVVATPDCPKHDGEAKAILSAQQEK